eukprot:367487_1
MLRGSLNFEERKQDVETNSQSLLVVFFGFMGSKPRHMQKYHQIFNEFKNSLTIHTIYPLRSWKDTFKTHRLKSLATDSLNYIATFIEKKRKLNKKPIVIFYAFSNAGAILVSIINDLLCNHNKYKNMLHEHELFINGIIFESC